MEVLFNATCITIERLFFFFHYQAQTMFLYAFNPTLIILYHHTKTSITTVGSNKTHVSLTTHHAHDTTYTAALPTLCQKNYTYFFSHCISYSPYLMLVKESKRRLPYNTKRSNLLTRIRRYRLNMAPLETIYIIRQADTIYRTGCGANANFNNECSLLYIYMRRCNNVTIFRRSLVV